jgi:DNA-binding transcriptional ArsR family regulator
VQHRRPRQQIPQHETLDQMFGALADPIRRAMLMRLARGECSVTVLGDPFQVSAPAISKHLRVLERAGLIGRRKVGRVHYCRLRLDALRQGERWLQELAAFWDQQLDALGAYLTQEGS